MIISQKYCGCSKEARDRRVHTIWFHLYKAQELAKTNLSWSSKLEQWCLGR